MLAVMFFALFLGIGLALTREASAAVRSFEEALEGLYDVTMRLIGMVISLRADRRRGAALHPHRAARLRDPPAARRYVCVVVLALAIHQFVVYSLAVRLLGGMSPLAFFRGIQEAMLTAFSTASSTPRCPRRSRSPRRTSSCRATSAASS